MANRLVVAAGGGGGGGGFNGAGGAPDGATGSGGGAGTGATQSSGGANGQGGNNFPNVAAAGGGGGYFGGGFGTAGGPGSTGSGGGGGGGSSWVSPDLASATTLTAGANAGPGSLTLTPFYAAPALDGTNITNVPGTWSVSGSDVYRATGRVGIGTASPGHPLTVQAGATGNSPLLGFNSPAGTDKYNFSLQGGGLNLSESGVAGGRLFVQDGGNVGIGTTSPSQKLDVNGTVLVRDAYDLLLRDANAGLGWYGGTGGSKVFAAATGFDGPVLYGYSGGMLGSKDGGNRAALIWRASGNVGIGTTDPQAPLQVSGIALVGGGTLPNTTNATGLGWNAVNAGMGESELYNYRGLGSGGFRFFSVGNTGAPSSSNQVAFINSAGVYTALSDRRVKTNITPLGQGLRQVLALRPVSYDFHPSRQLKDGVVTFLPDDQPVRALGFVAQDLYQVVPEAVEKPKDESQEFYTVSYTTLVPVLTQAIQEQQAQIETLKAENAALKAAAAADKTQTTATLESLAQRLRALETGEGQARR